MKIFPLINMDPNKIKVITSYDTKEFNIYLSFQYGGINVARMNTDSPVSVKANNYLDERSALRDAYMLTIKNNPISIANDITKLLSKAIIYNYI